MNKIIWYIIMILLFMMNLGIFLLFHHGASIFGMGWCSALIFVRLLEDGAD